MGAVITTVGKMLGTDHRLYLAVHRGGRALLGMLKVGTKHLFISRVGVCMCACRLVLHVGVVCVCVFVERACDPCVRSCR